jgi:hypothetical protein
LLLLFSTMNLSGTAAMSDSASAATTPEPFPAGDFREVELDAAQTRRASAVSPVFSAESRSPPHLSLQLPAELVLIDAAFEDFRLEDIDDDAVGHAQLQPVHGRSGVPLPMTRDSRHLLRECAAALQAGVALEPLDGGLGGIYLVRDRNGHELAVFKPRDEEPGTPDGRPGAVDGLSASVRRAQQDGTGGQAE